jgi:hypothetical protein
MIVSVVFFFAVIPLMTSPSTGRKLPSNKQDVCLSDYAAWMPRRNDGDFLKRVGKTKPWGAFSFGYFSLGTQRKVTRQRAKQKARRLTAITNNSICRQNKNLKRSHRIKWSTLIFITNRFLISAVRVDRLYIMNWFN